LCKDRVDGLLKVSAPVEHRQNDRKGWGGHHGFFIEHNKGPHFQTAGPGASPLMPKRASKKASDPLVFEAVKSLNLGEIVARARGSDPFLDAL
jgi:hypothetical protein